MDFIVHNGLAHFKQFQDSKSEFLRIVILMIFMLGVLRISMRLEGSVVKGGLVLFMSVLVN